MDWVRFFLFAMAAVAMLVIGIAEIGGITDATGVVRHDAVVPCLVSAPIIAALALMFLFSAVGRSLPVVELYREGISCRMVGRSQGFSLGGRIGLAIALLSGRGFRQFMYRIEWPAFTAANVTGLPMMFKLHLYGTATDQHGSMVSGVTFAQHEFGSSLQAVAAAVNLAAASAEQRSRLPSWSSLRA